MPMAPAPTKAVLVISGPVPVIAPGSVPSGTGQKSTTGLVAYVPVRSPTVRLKTSAVSRAASAPPRIRSCRSRERVAGMRDPFAVPIGDTAECTPDGGCVPIPVPWRRPAIRLRNRSPGTAPAVSWTSRRPSARPGQAALRSNRAHPGRRACSPPNSPTGSLKPARTTSTKDSATFGMPLSGWPLHSTHRPTTSPCCSPAPDPRTTRPAEPGRGTVHHRTGSMRHGWPRPVRRRPAHRAMVNALQPHGKTIWAEQVIPVPSPDQPA